MNHSKYLITIFQAGSRYIVQLDNGDLTHSYRFQSMDQSLKDLIDHSVPLLVDLAGEIFAVMRSNYLKSLAKKSDEMNEFDEII